MLVVMVQAVILLNKQETLNLVPRAHVKKNWVQWPMIAIPGQGGGDRKAFEDC